MSVFIDGKGAYPNSRTDFQGASRVIEADGKPARRSPYGGSTFLIPDSELNGAPETATLGSPYTNRDAYPLRDYSRTGQVIGAKGSFKPEI